MKAGACERGLRWPQTTRLRHRLRGAGPPDSRVPTRWSSRPQAWCPSSGRAPPRSRWRTSTPPSAGTHAGKRRKLQVRLGRRALSMARLPSCGRCPVVRDRKAAEIDSGRPALLHSPAGAQLRRTRLPHSTCLTAPACGQRRTASLSYGRSRGGETARGSCLGGTLTSNCPTLKRSSCPSATTKSFAGRSYSRTFW